jgi:hypothetical protein
MRASARHANRAIFAPLARSMCGALCRAKVRLLCLIAPPFFRCVSLPYVLSDFLTECNIVFKCMPHHIKLFSLSACVQLFCFVLALLPPPPSATNHLAIFSSSARSAPITTQAGSGLAGHADGAGTLAQFTVPWGVAISSDGVFALVIDHSTPYLRRIAMATGVVSTLAGSGISSDVDGLGTSASFSSPSGVSISLDTSFALITDQSSHRIRRIDIATGAVTTLAGSLKGYADNAGTLALFDTPFDVAVSPDASFALVVEFSNRVRHVVIATGVVTTLAGSTGGYRDDTGTSALFSQPTGVAISSDASFALVSEFGNDRVRRVTISTGVVTTLAGSTEGYADGVGTSAKFRNLFSVSISPDSSFALVADGDDSRRLRLIALASGNVTTLAGSTRALTAFADGVGTMALFSGLRGVAIAPDGTYALICDSGNRRVRRAVLASPCFGGYYCPSGSMSPTQAACQAGSFCPPGSASVTACPSGGYCPGSARSTPVQCDAGSFCAMTGLSAVSGSCSPGYYCPPGASSSTQAVCTIGAFCTQGSPLPTN